jgi:hypothetical protein
MSGRAVEIYSQLVDCTCTVKKSPFSLPLRPFKPFSYCVIMQNLSLLINGLIFFYAKRPYYTSNISLQIEQ